MNFGKGIVVVVTKAAESEHTTPEWIMSGPGHGPGLKRSKS